MAIIACRDCHHCAEFGASLNRCLHPYNVGVDIDYLNGVEELYHPLIDFARLEVGSCGPHARLFKEKVKI